MTRLFDVPLDEGRPPVPVCAWPGWEWQPLPGGMIRARRGDTELLAHNFTTLLARIRRAEGEAHGRDGGVA